MIGRGLVEIDDSTFSMFRSIPHLNSSVISRAGVTSRQHTHYRVIREGGVGSRSESRFHAHGMEHGHRVWLQRTVDASCSDVIVVSTDGRGFEKVCE